MGAFKWSPLDGRAFLGALKWSSTGGRAFFGALKWSSTDGRAFFRAFRWSSIDGLAFFRSRGEVSNRCQKSQHGNGLALLVCGIGLLLVSSAAVDEVEEAGAVDLLAANGLSNDGWRFHPLKE